MPRFSAKTYPSRCPFFPGIYFGLFFVILAIFGFLRYFDYFTNFDHIDNFWSFQLVFIYFQLFLTIHSYSPTILAVWKSNLHKNVFLDLKTEDEQIFEKGKRQRSLFLV